MATSEQRPQVRALEALENAEALDVPAQAIAKEVRGLVTPGPLKDALAGTWLGHALHPLLTDVVIGSFLSATILDVIGGDDDGRAAERLIAVGLLSYPPTAITGTTDWADTELGDPRARRVGLAHAAANASALSLYAASLAARRRGNTGRGKALSLAGSGALALGGFLGAHMSFAQGVGINQTAFDTGPTDWTDAAESSALVADAPEAVVVDDTPIVLVRHQHGIHALHDRCSHRGCLLSDGKLDGEIIECVCHGSRFRLDDGTVEQGPATQAQPAFEVRESEGQIQVRLRGPAT
jgi:nitrite reductase/ring-hydroxylating ferredoxin subunit